jgi:hypothetical protein
VSEGLGLGAPGEWSFYIATSVGARVCLGGWWARRMPLVGRLGRACAGLLPTGYTGRLLGLIGLPVLGRAVPSPVGLG